MSIKKQSEIKTDVADLKKEGDDASDKLEALTKFAERTKAVFEELKGSATDEGDKAAEGAVLEIQASIDRQYAGAEKELKKVNEKLQDKQEDFQGAIAADKQDLKKLKPLSQEAKTVGADAKAIQKAEQAKTSEIDFLVDQAGDIKKTKAELQQEANLSRQRKDNARFKHQSRNTLGGTEKK
jgi:chromosome segregation ATPase